MNHTTSMERLAFKRSFKDSLFKSLFGSEDWKGYTLSLYNALNGTHYDDLDALQMTTIDNVVYMGYKNDVSFIIGSDMVLWEHQSTRNPNMPLRGLFYFSHLFSSYLTRENLSQYSSKQLSIPTPRYYVFYNGIQDAPDREEFRLSDSFANGPGDIEVTATVLNINEGHNSAIMRACEALSGYARLIGLARQLIRVVDPADAIDMAIRQCIDEGVLGDYLRERRSEVIDSFLTEWDEDEYRAVLRKESREDGHAEGLAAGLAEGRAEGRVEGRAEGLAEGRAEGLAEGRAEGLAEGRAKGLAEGRADSRADFLMRAAALVRAGELELRLAIEAFGFSEDEMLEAIASLEDEPPIGL